MILRDAGSIRDRWSQLAGAPLLLTSILSVSRRILSRAVVSRLPVGASHEEGLVNDDRNFQTSQGTSY